MSGTSGTPSRHKLLASLAAVAAVGVGLYAIHRFRMKAAGSPAGRDSQKPKPRVSALWVYPVKGCSGTPVSKVEFTGRGVRYDREWAIFRRSNGKFCSQRDFPKLKRLCASVVEEENSTQNTCLLRIVPISDAVTAVPVKGEPGLLVPVRSQEELEADSAHRVDVTIWDLAGAVVDEGPEAAAWLSQYLGDEVFLGRILVHRRPADSARHGPFVPPCSAEIFLQDFSPLHLCTEEGLQHLRESTVDASINAQRFRPNVVVAGVAFPDEDRWERFSVNDVKLLTVKLTSRCTVPTVRDDGTRDAASAVASQYLKKHRSVSERGGKLQPVFGLSVFVDEPISFAGGTISVGDEIHVTSYREPISYNSTAE